MEQPKNLQQLNKELDNKVKNRELENIGSSSKDNQHSKNLD